MATKDPNQTTSPLPHNDAPPEVPFDARFPCVLSLDGVEFYVRWDAMAIGQSAFLRTIMPMSEINRALARVSAHWGIAVAARARIEHGFRGVRVWRIG